MTADAVVVAAGADGFVDLEFTPATGCAGCAGTCLWKRLSAARVERLVSAARFEPGAEVTVSLPERRILLVSILLHGLPLAAILAGAMAGAAIGGGDAGTLTGALAALAVVVGGFGRWRGRLERATLEALVIRPRA